MMEEITKNLHPKLNQRRLQEKENLGKQVKRVCTPQENKRKREQSNFQQQPLKKVRIEEHVMIDEMDTPIEEELEEEELNHQFIQFLHEPKSLADRMCLITSMTEQFHFFDFISKKLKNLTNFNFLKNEISANKIRLEYVNESDFIRIFSAKYSQYSLEKPIHIYISNLIYHNKDPSTKNGGDLLKKALIVFYQEWKEERSIFSGFIHDLLLEDDKLFEGFCLKIQQNLENGKISQMMKQIGVFFKLHEGNASEQLNNFLKLGFKSPSIDAL
jgi:hypothetical protein